MSPRSLTTGDEPEVIVEAVYGNLQVEGWERAEILLQSNNDETAVLKQEGEAFRAKTTGDCLLHVPYRAKLSIGNVHGGARIKKMENLVRTGRVLGSLAFDEVGAIQVESVYGEFLARGIAGDTSIDQVLGNAWIEEIKGNCSLERVAGNLDVRSTGGNVRASTSGDAHIHLDTLTGTSFKIEASGDITFDITGNIDARVQISSRGNDITLSLPDGNRRLTSRSYELTQGNGTASILLAASGSVRFSFGDAGTSGEQGTNHAFAGLAEDISQKISGEVESQLETQMKILDEQMVHLSDTISRAGVASAEADRIMRRARESSERANLRAQEKMQRAREKLDRKLATAQRKVEERERAAGQRKESQEKRTWSFEWQTPASPAPRQPETSDEERLLILRMLEQKKISLAEAEQLLEALEGKGG